MVKQLAARRVSCNNHAPIWAWHSCRKFEKAPTLTDARALLSDIELEEGIQTIEFECPAELVLLSSYDVWNKILDDFFYTNTEDKIDKKTEDWLFNVDKKIFKRYDCIQAALPYIKLEWVKEIRELKLKPGENIVNWEEEV